MNFPNEIARMILTGQKTMTRRPVKPNEQRCGFRVGNPYMVKAKGETKGWLYGTIPIEEFDAKRDALVDPDPEKYRTFREDYEFYGAEQGEVVASYGGVCSECGIALDFKHSERFWEPS